MIDEKVPRFVSALDVTLSIARPVYLDRDGNRFNIKKFEFVKNKWSFTSRKHTIIFPSVNY